jgi:hypothetical protein
MGEVQGREVEKVGGGGRGRVATREGEGDSFSLLYCD